MENKDIKIRDLSEGRFGSIICLLRLAGIPFHMKKMSTIYALYMITVVFCSCITFLGMLLDVYVHRDDLRHAMTTVRVVIPLTNNIWMYFYCRYVTTGIFI
jgi:hypothetical protein